MNALLGCEHLLTAKKKEKFCNKKDFVKIIKH